MKQEVFLFQVDGVNTNFRMPDVLSIGLGGGWHVKHHENNKVGVASYCLVHLYHHMSFRPSLSYKKIK